MKIALDPTPFHRSHTLLEFPPIAADLGWATYVQLPPHRVGEIGFLASDDTVLCSSVFAQDENALEVDLFQLLTLRQYASSASSRHGANKASV